MSIHWSMSAKHCVVHTQNTFKHMRFSTVKHTCSATPALCSASLTSGNISSTRCANTRWSTWTPVRPADRGDGVDRTNRTKGGVNQICSRQSDDQG